MKDEEIVSWEQMRAFLEGSGEVEFQAQQREQLYEWVNGVLRQHDYLHSKRPGKGLVRLYLAKMTGLGRAQTARLIRCYLEAGEVKAKPYRRHRFAQRYTRRDIELLAATDEAHETLSGPATQKTLQRELHEFRDRSNARRLVFTGLRRMVQNLPFVER